MSTIIVVKKSGKVAIAADTISIYGDMKVPARHLKNRSKIHKCGSSYIGVVGSAANSNVLASIIDKYGRRLSFRSVKDIFETYRKLHPILKDEYYINVSESDHDEYESSQIDGLIANPYGIFGIYTWREVYEYDRFWAIGSGSEFALGAMYAAYDQVDDVEEIARLGIEASCEFDSGSGLPYTLHSARLLKAKAKG